jgi:hypothetical protein
MIKNEQNTYALAVFRTVHEIPGFSSATKECWIYKTSTNKARLVKEGKWYALDKDYSYIVEKIG